MHQENKLTSYREKIKKLTCNGDTVYHSHLEVHRDVLHVAQEISYHYDRHRNQWNTTLERELGREDVWYNLWYNLVH